jgi:hypothetical protein
MRSALNLDSKLKRSMLRFLGNFASTISTMYLSFVDLVALPEICECISRSPGQRPL